MRAADKGLISIIQALVYLNIIKKKKHPIKKKIGEGAKRTFSKDDIQMVMNTYKNAQRWSLEKYKSKLK